MGRSVLGVMLALAALPAAAQERATAPDAAQPPAEAAAQPRGEADPITVTGEREAREAEDRRRVCRREVRTGSLMPETTCRSVAEWREVRERSITELERMRADRRSRENTQHARDRGN